MEYGKIPVKPMLLMLLIDPTACDGSDETFMSLYRLAVDYCRGHHLEKK